MINKKHLLYKGSEFLGNIFLNLKNNLKIPVFIIGTGRCGTSLLLKILNSHDELIGFPVEANELWHPKSYPYSHKSIDTPSIIENPKKFTQLSVSNWPSNHKKRIKLIFTGYSNVAGRKKLLFVKSAMISFLIPEILEIFPEAKLIHIYRNGPSVVESIIKKEWQKYSHLVKSKDEFRKLAASYWNDCIIEIEDKKKQYDLDLTGQLYEFSYEKLCEFPIEVFDDLLDFLSLSKNYFNFDHNNIKSTNYKAGDYKNESKWLEYIKIMKPAMQLKGYL